MSEMKWGMNKNPVMLITIKMSYLPRFTGKMLVKMNGRAQKA